MLNYLAGSEGFLGLDNSAIPEEAQAVIIPFGLEASVSYGCGTAKGPAAILNASHQVELFDEELEEIRRALSGGADLRE